MYKNTMEDYIRLLSTKGGDVYHITLSEDIVLFSHETQQVIGDVKVVGIDLRRLAGTSPTGHGILSAIEKVIADFFTIYGLQKHGALSALSAPKFCLFLMFFLDFG